MTDRKNLITIFVIAVIVLGVSSIYWFTLPEAEEENTNLKLIEPVILPAGNCQELTGEIVIAGLVDYDFIESPLEISGQARGDWFEEGEFSGRLVTEGGLVLAKTFAVAEGNWMTKNFVSFTAVFEFEPGEAESGTIFFTKSNSLGEAEENLELKIPIKLKK